jgi:hypothetical protein
LAEAVVLYLIPVRRSGSTFGIIHDEVARLKMAHGESCGERRKNVGAKVDDETLIGYHGLHTQKRANQLSVALNFNDVSSAVLLNFLHK